MAKGRAQRSKPKQPRDIKSLHGIDYTMLTNLRINQLLYRSRLKTAF